ncbi:MAG TPA: crossover junction endodeoxyribonuclease RuvC [Actinomycetota bacterium]|nr:crossover junction endodeoxyribonuclease RuvC [Actinomycetota bacterium]
MFEHRVLGVDPGTAAIGLAVVEGSARQQAVTWASTVRTPTAIPPAERLRRLHETVAHVIRTHQPDTMALEALMWGQNRQSAMQVARATGVITLAAAQAGVPVVEYPPLQVKMAVTGVGNAPKDAVQRGLVRILGVSGVPEELNAADAVATAVCHLQHERLRRVKETAAP